jgi:hypothetical protein
MGKYNGINPYFGIDESFGEKDLFEDLCIEAIQFRGIDMMYLPRTLNHYDKLLVEDDQSSYEVAIPLACYVKSVDGFGGDKDFFSKFGYEVRDQVTFSFAKSIWESDVGTITGKPRPGEGDVLYFPLANKLYQIKYVDYKPEFYELGTIPWYDVVCELFEFSHELVATGIPEIDQIRADYSINILDYALRDTNGYPLVDTNGNYIVDTSYGDNFDLINAQNEIVDQENVSNNVIDYTVLDPFTMKEY